MHLTSPLEGTDGAQQFVESHVSNHPKHYFYPNQYENDGNWESHLKSTGPEIWVKRTGQLLILLLVWEQAVHLLVRVGFYSQKVCIAFP